MLNIETYFFYFLLNGGMHRDRSLKKFCQLNI